MSTANPTAAAPLLACTDCPHVFVPTQHQLDELASTGCPNCGGWTWLVSTTCPDDVPAPRVAEEIHDD
jgi:predicted  nucleic acid-binding Zn-ribbon protein